MKKYIDGVYVEFTDEELAQLKAEATQQPAPEQTSEERIAALEEELAATKILLGLEE